ncbi:MAG: efflux RND transporter periplasmic adaptor subunit [Isosphaeraceae bacterium]
MRLFRMCGIAASLALIAATTAADDLPSRSADVVLLRQCAIDYERTATLGTNQAGVLQKSEVKMGDRVKAGQIIGRMQDEDLRADLEHRSAVAASDVEVRMDEKTYEWSAMKLKMLENLRQNKYTSEEEYRLQKLAAENAKLAVEEARNRRHLAYLQLRIAEAGVRIRQFVSPIDGVIVEILKTEGESINFNDPVFRIVDPSLLRVTGAVDVADLWRVRPGDLVHISPDIGGADLPIEHREFPGRITFVSRQIDPATQTCSVIAQVENREELLRAGLRCTMSITPGSAPKEGKAAEAKAESNRGPRGSAPLAPGPARVAGDVPKASPPQLKSDL